MYDIFQNNILLSFTISKEIIFQELVIGKMNIKIKDGEKLKLQDKFDVIYFE